MTKDLELIEARASGALDGCTWLVRSAEGRGFGPILPGSDVARAQLFELLEELKSRSARRDQHQREH